MRLAALVIVAVLLCGPVGCTGALGGERVDAGGGLDAPALPGLDAPALPGTDAPIAPGTDAPVSPGTDAGPEPTIDAGPCGSSLASSIAFVDLPGIGGGAQAYPTPSGGVVVASPGGGSITVQRFDGAGGVFGPSASVAGDGLWGVAASAAQNAVLVSRGDELVLVILPSGGGAAIETRLMGAVDHGVMGSEWFGDLLRAGRLDWNGSEWITYATVQRLWPDGIAHYGDTLRRYSPTGAAAGVEWDWGCSHSMEVRLTHGPSGELGPVCSSDCYPEKGVFFRHRTTVYLDSSGNCAGYVQQALGGVAAVGSDFLVGFTSAEGRGSVDPGVARWSGGSVTAPVWLSDAAGDASELHVAPFESGAVAAWIDGAEGRIVRLSATGAPVGAPETLASSALSGAGDFFVYADGDVGWLVGSRLARLCAAP